MSAHPFPSSSNSRIDEIQAALLDVKLKYLDEDNQRRQQIADRFYREIDNPRITLPGKRRWLNGEEDNVFHIFPILCEDRDALQSYLKEKGVQTLSHRLLPTMSEDETEQIIGLLNGFDRS